MVFFFPGCILFSLDIFRGAAKPPEMNKEIIIQYADLQREAKEVRNKIKQLNTEIEKLENALLDIDPDIDVVNGGYGNNQRFEIEGYTSLEYREQKAELLLKKLFLNQRKSTLELLEYDILSKTNDVEQYISSIDDSYMRRIINLRVIEGLKWEEVADRMGSGYTSDSLKKAFYRYIK